ncbi:hypothetical protein Y032_0005g2696 [Ancylostoma ceylanicum]|uniref:Uncharacterized protein n=1 Tax=Ancylostoma ceylanicum TaxID=53326 RepID=A0A016VSJ1_9BILA|nr:hypothetical protein Y032_0005g2696 [Ancylostoma ceylanicum]
MKRDCASCVTSKGVHDAETSPSRLGSAHSLPENWSSIMGFIWNFVRNNIYLSDRWPMEILLMRKLRKGF